MIGIEATFLPSPRTPHQVRPTVLKRAIRNIIDNAANMASARASA